MPPCRSLAFAPLAALILAASAAGQASEPAAKAALPGIGSWTQYRGDPMNSGVSHSPRPAYKGIKWKYFAGAPLTSTPAVAAGKVIAPSEGGFVNAIDIETGNKAWITQCGTGAMGQGIVFTSPLVYDGKVFVGSKTGTLYCLNLETGAEEYKVELADKPIYASPKGDARGIVVGSSDGAVHCIDPKDGARKWTVKTHREVGATAAIVGDRILVPCKDRILYEIAYGSGEVVRRLQMPSTSNSTPTVGLGFAYVMMSSGKAAAIDILSGEVGYEIETSGDDQMTGAVADGVLYLPVGQFLRAYNGATGEQLWEIRCGHKVAPPVVNGDDVLFTCRDRKFRVADKKTGEVTYSLDFEDGFVAGPVVVDGRVFVATDVNSGVHVYAIE